MSSGLQPALPAEIVEGGEDLGPTGRRGRRPFIRRAGFEDYDQIAAVEARHGLTTKSRDQWLDLWLENPAYLERRHWPIGWVIDDGKGAIVGSLGNVPTLFELGGRTYVAAAGRGWAVDLPYRALSVILLVHQLKQSGADLNIITTASAVTTALCTQLGWSRVPVGEWDSSAFWITNYTRAVQGFLAARTSKGISWLAGAVLAPPFLLKDAISRRPHPFESDYRLEWRAAFDTDFDGFWEELKAQNPGRLLAGRDGETLRWHFRHGLQKERIWILAAYRQARLAGYAILERREIRSLDLSRVLFLDLQMLSKDPVLGSAMVHAALARCRREGIHVLENTGCWMDKVQPIDPPPYRRKLGNWSYLYRVSNPDLDRSLLGPASWYPTQYDGDASL